MTTHRSVEPVMRLDISTADYLFALRCCGSSSEAQRPALEAQLEAEWSQDHGEPRAAPAAAAAAAAASARSLSPTALTALTALSVRTGFDAFLTELRLPRQSEVLMSAVTIPDMVRIVEAHGLVPVPVDVAYDSLAPRVDLMRRALSPRTRVVVVSHVFGSIAGNMDEVTAWAHAQGLRVVEDCAEVYCGPRYRGHPAADISLFSFGTIKTDTALGGALLRVRDERLRAALRERLAHYAVQPTAAYASRVGKLMAFSSVLNSQKLYWAFVHGLAAAGKDHLDVLLANSRGFAGQGQDFFQAIRLRPCVPLLRLLQRRLRSHDAERLRRRADRCALAVALILEDDALARRVSVPGTGALAEGLHHFWLFPVNVADPHAVARKMLLDGFDATSTTTSLACVGDFVTGVAAVEKKEASSTSMPQEASVSQEASASQEASEASWARSELPVARRIMDGVLYLPIDADTSRRTVERMVESLARATAPPPASHL